MGRGILRVVRGGVLGVGVVAILFWVAGWFCAWEAGAHRGWVQWVLIGSSQGKLIYCRGHGLVLIVPGAPAPVPPPWKLTGAFQWGGRLTTGLVASFRTGPNWSVPWWEFVAMAGLAYAALRPWGRRRPAGRGFPVLMPEGTAGGVGGSCARCGSPAGQEPRRPMQVGVVVGILILAVCGLGALGRALVETSLGRWLEVDYDPVGRGLVLLLAAAPLVVWVARWRGRYRAWNRWRKRQCSVCGAGLAAGQAAL